MGVWLIRPVTGPGPAAVRIARTGPTTLACARAGRFPVDSTISAELMAGVGGISMLKAAPRPAFQFDRGADFLNVCLHHIHAFAVGCGFFRRRHLYRPLAPPSRRGSGVGSPGGTRCGRS
jgi:hypothetical protein